MKISHHLLLLGEGERKKTMENVGGSVFYNIPSRDPTTFSSKEERGEGEKEKKAEN